jgi:aminoglycoside/choline kinase family phosphotransferase
VVVTAIFSPATFVPRPGVSVHRFPGNAVGRAAYDLASLLYDPYVKLSLPFGNGWGSLRRLRPEYAEAVERLTTAPCSAWQALGA